MYLKNLKRHEEIYEKISSLFGIKFKTQLRNSPVEFNSFYLVKNVINNKEFYSLGFSDKESIEFISKDDFIDAFINYLQSKIKAFEDEFEHLNNIDFDGFKYDENEMFMRHEHIGHGTEKLNQIIEKMKKYK